MIWDVIIAALIAAAIASDGKIVSSHEIPNNSPVEFSYANQNN